MWSLNLVLSFKNTKTDKNTLRAASTGELPRQPCEHCKTTLLTKAPEGSDLEGAERDSPQEVMLSPHGPQQTDSCLLISNGGTVQLLLFVSQVTKREEMT